MVVSANVDHVKYSINKSKLTLGMVGPQWEQKIVAELDSAINKWIDMVPLHCECSTNIFRCRHHNPLNRSTMGPRSR